MRNNNTEFWEANFVEKQEMWGMEPSKSTVWASDFFVQNGVKNILIPGIGYGRNAQLFVANGMEVTGIEISETAVKLARKHYGAQGVIHWGSVTDMPFDDRRYGGVYCYALIHLLDAAQRLKLIEDCYEQLEENGYMIFTAISKTSASYGQGKLVSSDRYEIFEGVQMYFYDRHSIEAEFGNYGLFDLVEIEENQPFFLIKCQKTKATKDKRIQSK